MQPFVSSSSRSFALALVTMISSVSLAAGLPVDPGTSASASVHAQLPRSPYPPGELVEEAVSSFDTTQSYALYLPSRYTSDRTWPLLIVMDPRGRALPAIKLFTRAAEELGYIVLSSYNTVSDGPWEPNAVAMRAMLADVEALWTFDSQRIYLAGFSGTAKAGWTFTNQLSGYIAGVIGFGGGLPPNTEIPDTGTFAFFGAARTTDFNYQDMRTTDALLDETNIPHRLAFFDGGHQWGPEQLAYEALYWMELQAIKLDLRGANGRFVGSYSERRLEEARSSEAAGDLVTAFRRYEDFAEDFNDIADTAMVETAAAKRAELSKTDTVRRRLDRDRELENQQEKFVERFRGWLGRFDSAQRPPPLHSSLQTLGVRELQAQSTSGDDPLAAQAATRLLQIVAGHAVFYEPRDHLEDNPRRVLAMLEVAKVIQPNNPQAWINEARAHAQAGDSEGALEALERLVELGTLQGARGADFIESDTYLQKVAGSDGVADLIRDLRDST